MKTAKPQYGANAYVEHLSLGQLALADQNVEASPAADIEVIDAYMAQPEKTEFQPLVVLEYKLKATPGLQRVVAPIGSSENSGEYSALLSVMHKLEETPYTLHNVYLRVATVTPNATLAVSDETLDRTRKLLQRQQQLLLENSEKPAPLAEVRQLLQLIEFFIDHRFRDAAYLSVDNVKQSLAAAAQSGQSKDALLNLSQELEVLETRLHRTMPFTL